MVGVGGANLILELRSPGRPGRVARSAGSGTVGRVGSEISEIVISDPRNLLRGGSERVGRSDRPGSGPDSRGRPGRSVGDVKSKINFDPPCKSGVEGSTEE